ncbi:MULTISPECIES: DUF3545 family protein [Thalassomonas]|uniref:DUF3545 family protein n=1 Tax=Thalassomonas actiniarum TaxID=485447 RepID=A0AAE9YPF6_9GAMM|nr:MULTISPECIES: DUF3545 family protein [Thalassomonas]WDD97844.1 DUF3545 family protein [Thalassomonas actiniarum]
MKFNNWEEFDDIYGDESLTEQKKNNKTRKRKWREIEAIKEKQRLRRELAEFYHEAL